MGKIFIDVELEKKDVKLLDILQRNTSCRVLEKTKIVIFEKAITVCKILVENVFIDVVVIRIEKKLRKLLLTYVHCQ